MFSSILGPGTIFVMIVGALQTAFGAFGFDIWTSLWMNGVPLLLFIISCYVCKGDTQVRKFLEDQVVWNDALDDLPK